MTTVSDLIEDTKRLLFTGGVEERNKLSAAITYNATQATFAYPLGSINRGSKLSINLEDIYVWDKVNLTATIERGQFGSVANGHPINSLVHVNPKFSNWEIFNAINDEINSLASPMNGLFHVQTVQIEYNPVIEGYSYEDNNLIDIYDVQYETTGPSLAWYQSADYELSRHMGSEFAAGSAIFIRDAFPNRSVLVKGKFAFTPLAMTMETDASMSNVPVSCWDILAIGAAWRLASPREVRRNFYEVQGDTRRSEEVPPGANLGGARELGRLRQLRINEEASRLSAQYPARSPRYPFIAGGF